MRPNFLVIGAMKSATTTLWEILRRHPQISMPAQKDLAFFCTESQFARGWEWYEARFPGADGKVAIGECTVGYTKHVIFPDTSRRIATHLPDAKLIYIVRNPLERIESHWRHLLGRGHDVASFDEFLRSQPDVVDTSCYWRQIGAYRAHFPDEKILVLFFEEFVKDQQLVLKRCFEFLRVDPALGAADAKLAANVSKGSRMDGSLIRLRPEDAGRTVDKTGGAGDLERNRTDIAPSRAGAPNLDRTTAASADRSAGGRRRVVPASLRKARRLVAAQLRDRLPARLGAKQMNRVSAREQIALLGVTLLAMELPLCARRAPGA